VQDKAPRLDCKAHPDEKGTESHLSRSPLSWGGTIARPIPMKRELKACGWWSMSWMIRDCKAHPDEKGTESETFLDPLVVT